MSNLISYLASTLTFSTVLLLTVMIWRGRLQGFWLIQALVITIAWSLYLGISGWSGEFNQTNQAFLEMLRNVSWIMFIWKLHACNLKLSNSQFWRQRHLWYFGIAVAFLLCLNLLQTSVVQLSAVLPVSASYLAIFLLDVFALFMLEQWYRNIAQEQRWSIRFLAVALLVMFGYDFMLYSEAFLYNRPDSQLWQARGWVDAILAPLMAVSVARSRDWDQVVRVSHQAAFYTTGIVLAGIYLLLMALVGYYLRWFGSGWGSAVQIVFVVFALSFLGLMVGSGRIRGLVSVWISKHFFTYKYDYREEWVRANARLASLPLEAGYFDQLILTMSEPFDSPGGVVWTKKDADYGFSASWGCSALPDFRVSDDASIINFCQQKGWAVELDEYRENPNHYPGLNLPGWLLNSDELWVIVPLLHQDALYGFMGLRHPRANRSINWEDHDLFKALGAQLAALIALKDANDALTEARQFEAFNRLSAFVVHDLKNIVAQLSLVVTNAERHKHNPEFIDDALDTLSNAVKRMNRLLSQLRQQSQLNIRHEIADGRQVAIDVQVHQKEQRPTLQLENVDSDLRLRVERERLVSVLCHLVQNAQEATGDSGRVAMSCLQQGAFVVYTVSDNGCGMDEKFIRERLFRPFDTTKGRAGMGIGVYEAQQFVRSCGGRIEVESKVGEGTVFRVYLPLSQQKDLELERVQ